ncbi:lipopolysaccharide biosynthesis protein [Globicatella sanguinis]|uniref:lipopolysaccharide biosynthesis protein n=1 Tax=Globicatella sanguinis TaxID=13076 RepID=UPI000825A434|nr:lipopolysaccharide biosynthesis protein [Globicatella sanguinis]
MIENFKKGILYTAIAKYSNVVIQLLTTSILSRILTPEEYGVIAVVNVFIIFFQMLADFGIGPAIIQSNILNKNDINNLFGLTIVVGLIISVIFAFLGIPISYIYNDQRYIFICVLLSISLFFYTCTIVPQALLLKKVKFKEVNMITLLCNLLVGISSVIFALNNFSFYSIILGNILRSVGLFIGFFYFERIIPSKKIDIKSFKKISSFSNNQFGFNFINYFARNLDNLLIGRFINPQALGYYEKGYQLSLYPNQILSQVITPVIQPLLKDYINKKDIMYKYYLAISKILILIGLPISIFCFFNAESIIIFLFGNQWRESIVIFQLLSISIWMQMANSCTGAFYQSADRTDLLFRVGLVTSLINIIAIIIGIVFNNIKMIALMLIISFSLSLLINIIIINRILFSSQIRIYFFNLKGVSFSSIIYIFVSLVISINFDNDLITLILNFGVLLLIILPSYYLTGEIKFLKSFIKVGIIE